MTRPLPEPGVEATETFVVAGAHTTTVFGRQSSPPGRAAATDAAPADATPVLGSPHLLARFEFLARESVRGSIPDGTGVVGVRGDLRHRRPAPLGTELRVRTRLTAVDGRELTFEGELRTVTDESGGEPVGESDDGSDDESGGASGGESVGEGTVVLAVVDRDRFRDRVGD